MKMNLTTKLGAMFKFAPQGSQQLVVLFGVVAAISAVVAMSYCLTSNPWIAVVPGVIFLVSAGLSTAMWWHSHLTNDLANAKPTTFKPTEHGYNISVDSRLTPSPDSLFKFCQALQDLSYRKPLPRPNGMLRPDGSPDASRQEEAARITDGINQTTLRLRDETLVWVQGALTSQSSMPPPIVQSNPTANIEISRDSVVVNSVETGLQSSRK